MYHKNIAQEKEVNCSAQRKLSFENFRLDKVKVIMSGHLRCLFLGLGKVSRDLHLRDKLFTIYIWGSRESQPRLVI